VGALNATNQNSFMAPIMHCSMNKLLSELSYNNFLSPIEYSDCHHCWDSYTKSWCLCVPKRKIFIYQNNV